ncbi:NUDIX domain-containing protein [bacterium]|nr:MAG: NUDIX domain-containing protein [bacterium]
MIQRLAAYGVIVEDGRILLCRLGHPEPDQGKWTLPGGGLDFGEHPETAAIREVREETGFEVRLGQLLEVQSEVHPSMHGTMHSVRFLYRAEIVGGTLTTELDGSTDLASWHSLEEANALPKVPLAARGVELAFGRSD